MAKAHKELELEHNTVAVTEDELLPEPVLMEHHNYIKSGIKGFRCFPNLTVFFRHLKLYFWNYFEYELLEYLIKQRGSEKLKSEMANYTKSVKRFQQQTTLTEFISCERDLVRKKSIPPNFKDMVTEHSIDPDDYTLYEIENFRVDVHRLLSTDLSECAFQMYTITKCDRIVIQWIFPEELTEKLFYIEYQELMRSHHIERLLIEGESSHSVRLY